MYWKRDHDNVDMVLKTYCEAHRKEKDDKYMKTYMDTNDKWYLPYPSENLYPWICKRSNYTWGIHTWPYTKYTLQHFTDLFEKMSCNCYTRLIFCGFNKIKENDTWD